MATATVSELRFGRVGGRRGVSGVEEPRTFRVALTVAASEDASETAPDPRFFVESLYPIGSAHPWNQFAGVQDYEIVGQLAPTIYDVRVRYAATASPDRPPQTGWLRSSRATSIQLRRLADLDGKPIGQRLYIPIAESIGRPGAGYWAQTWSVDEDGVLTKKWVTLEQTDAVEVDGEDVDMPGIATTFTKLIADDGTNLEPKVRPYIKRLNELVFLGASPKHVYFDDFDLQPDTSVAFQPDPDPTGLPRIIRRTGTAVLADQAAIGFAPVPAWRISMTFVASDLPFDPVERTPVYRDQETGGEGVVMLSKSDGTFSPAIETFRVRETADFISLFRILNR